MESKNITSKNGLELEKIFNTLKDKKIKELETKNKRRYTETELSKFSENHKHGLEQIQKISINQPQEEQIVHNNNVQSNEVSLCDILSYINRQEILEDIYDFLFDDEMTLVQAKLDFTASFLGNLNLNSLVPALHNFNIGSFYSIQQNNQTVYESVLNLLTQSNGVQALIDWEEDNSDLPNGIEDIEEDDITFLLSQLTIEEASQTLTKPKTIRTSGEIINSLKASPLSGRSSESEEDSKTSESNPSNASAYSSGSIADKEDDAAYSTGSFSNNNNESNTTSNNYISTAYSIISQYDSLEDIWMQFLLEIKIPEYEDEYTQTKQKELQKNLTTSIRFIKEQTETHSNNNSQISAYEFISLPAVKNNGKICFYIFDFLIDDEMNVCEDQLEFLSSLIKEIGSNELVSLLEHFYICNFYEIKTNNEQIYKDLILALKTKNGLETLKRMYPHPYQDNIETITLENVKQLQSYSLHQEKKGQTSNAQLLTEIQRFWSQKHYKTSHQSDNETYSSQSDDEDAESFSDKINDSASEEGYGSDSSLSQ